MLKLASPKIFCWSAWDVRFKPKNGRVRIFSISARPNTGCTDGEHEGNDQNREHDGKNRAEVLLKGFLDPGNHEE